MSDADIQVVEVTSLDEIMLIDKAKEVGETLSRHYPGHLWMVGWADGGVLVVKNAAISSHYGFTIDCGNSFSASQLAHLAVEAGGELLERAHMPRGAWDGRFAEVLEGADPQFFKPTH